MVGTRCTLACRSESLWWMRPCGVYRGRASAISRLAECGFDVLCILCSWARSSRFSVASSSRVRTMVSYFSIISSLHCRRRATSDSRSLMYCSLRSRCFLALFQCAFLLTSALCSLELDYTFELPGFFGLSSLVQDSLVCSVQDGFGIQLAKHGRRRANLQNGLVNTALA